MIKKILLLILGSVVGIIATMVTFFIKNHNYYLDHPLFKQKRHSLKVRVHTACDTVQVLNAQGSVIHQFTNLSRPDQLLISDDLSEKNPTPFSLKVYTRDNILYADSLFVNKSFEKVFIENKYIQKDTIN